MKQKKKKNLWQKTGYFLACAFRFFKKIRLIGRLILEEVQKEEIVDEQSQNHLETSTTVIKPKAESLSATTILQNARDFILNQNLSIEQIKIAFAELIDNYEKLLNYLKTLCKISDKLECKLNSGGLLS